MMRNESRIEKIGKNIITGFGNKVIMLILAFVSRKVFIQYIGVEYLGINNLFSNVLVILSMADMGLGVAMAYSYYKPLAEKNYESLSGLLHYYRKMYIFIAMAVLALGLTVLPFLKYVVNTSEPIENMHLFYLIALLNTVASYLFVYKSTLIIADQKTYVVNNIQILITTSKVLMQILVVYLFKNYLFFILLDVVATVTNNVLLSMAADKIYPEVVNNPNQKLSSQEKNDIFSNIKSVFIYKFSASIMGGTDSIRKTMPH